MAREAELMVERHEISDRVGQLEQEQARHGERLRQVAGEVADVREAVRGVGTDVKQLLEREAHRPEALSWRTIAATCGSLVAVAYVVWWLIGSAPAVVDLGRRLDRLDDPAVGRVGQLERRQDKLDGWHAVVRK